MDWQPIETAPKDGTSILLLIEDVAIEGYWEVPTYASGKPYWYVPSVSSHGCGCCPSDNEEPTHWMPLPAKPEK